MVNSWEGMKINFGEQSERDYTSHVCFKIDRLYSVCTGDISDHVPDRFKVVQGEPW